jgi:hypothetical protein
MRKIVIGLVALASLGGVVALSGSGVGRAQAQADPYPAMASLDSYLMADEKAEVLLARSAAPPSISGRAEVMVLRRNGYVTAWKGGNGFVCMVQRSWAAATEFSEFWNARILAPICLNAAAAKTMVPLILMKTKLAIAAKSRAEIAGAVKSAMDKGTVPALEPGAMCYMMSKQQYLSDHDLNWHPHLMWFVPEDGAEAWGANLTGSPVLAANDPEDRMTIMLVWVGHWSDGTAAPRDESARVARHTAD